MYEGREVHAGFQWKNLTERDHFEDLGMDGRIMLQEIFKKMDEGVDWNFSGLEQGPTGWLL